MAASAISVGDYTHNQLFGTKRKTYFHKVIIIIVNIDVAKEHIAVIGHLYLR